MDDDVDTADMCLDKRTFDASTRACSCRSRLVRARRAFARSRESVNPVSARSETRARDACDVAARLPEPRD